MNIPFTNKKLTTVKKNTYIPSTEEIRQSVFADTVPKQLPKLVETLVKQAYMAGEKAAQEKEAKTDTTKLIAVGAVGFLLGVMLVKSGIMPA